MVESEVIENEALLSRVIYGEAAIGYIAGMVDGEGCIVICHRPNGWRATAKLIISNNNKSALEFCQKIIGGNITVSRRATHNWKSNYHLHITTVPLLKRALHVLLPFLIIKKCVAQLVLEYIESTEKHYHSYIPRELEIVTEVKKLNGRGLK